MIKSAQMQHSVNYHVSIVICDRFRLCFRFGLNHWSAYCDVTKGIWEFTDERKYVRRMGLCTISEIKLSTLKFTNDPYTESTCLTLHGSSRVFAEIVHVWDVGITP
ncbi:uncharacterized protein METZ01_LOCUS58860 [marine metagenome]|uniref:Uncharacterized protein n=1 Tax=marine metagenome TaxID=408172 RepID=A0A381SPT8_9ZZZZ